MAMADYMLCEVCGGKAFYDANLNYESTRDPNDPQLSDLKDDSLLSMKLDRCAQVGAICHECYGNGFRLRVTKVAEPTSAGEATGDPT